MRVIDEILTLASSVDIDVFKVPNSRSCDRMLPVSSSFLL